MDKMKKSKQTKNHAFIFVKIDEPKTEKCQACKGTGIKKASKKYVVYCTECNGFGNKKL